MQRQIFLNGRDPLTIDPAKNLGAGGQAVVIKHDSHALKLWRQTDPLTQRKLEYILRQNWHLPANVILPQFPITDRPKGELIGFGMRLLPSHFKELATLFNKKLRARGSITIPLVLRIFDQAVATLQDIHQQGLIVGDLSGRNVSYVVKPQVQTFWYDVDSYHLPGFPCPVWTLPFVDPKLISSTQNGADPDFTQSTDWYGLTVSLFWALTFSHPYHGESSKYQNMLDLASNGLWLYHPKIATPAIALHPEVLSDDLLQFFEGAFSCHQRHPISTTLLQDSIDHAVQCFSCGVYYHNSRPSCPACTQKIPSPTFYKLRLDRLIDTKGPIVFARFQNNQLFAVSKEPGDYVLYRRLPQDKQVDTIPLYLSSQQDLRFDLIADHTLIINPEFSPNLKLLNFNQKTQIETTSMIYYGNQQAVFRGTNTGLLRLANRQLMHGTATSSHLLERPLPLTANLNQTWFWADPHSDTIFGLFRIFDLTQYWLITKSGRIELDVPQLKLHQTLQDISVKFSNGSILLRRLIRHKRRQVVSNLVFDLKGNLITQSETPLDRLPHPTIRGCAYSHLTLWIPSDQGLVKYNLNTDEFVVVADTKSAVTQVCSLIHLGKNTHFLVVGDRSVDYLVLP